MRAKAKNEMKLVIPSNSANESFARTAVAAFMAQLDPTIEEMTDIKTAVSEAVTNCIVHAYRDTIGNIWIEARIYDDGRFCVSVKDKGCGIPDIAKAREPLFTTAGSDGELYRQTACPLGGRQGHHRHDGKARSAEIPS